MSGSPPMGHATPDGRWWWDGSRWLPRTAAMETGLGAPQRRRRWPFIWFLVCAPGLCASTVDYLTWPDYSSCVVYGPLGGFDLLAAFLAHTLLLTAACYLVLLALLIGKVRPL